MLEESIPKCGRHQATHGRTLMFRIGLAMTKWLSASTIAVAIGCAVSVPAFARQQASDSQQSAADIWILPGGSDPKRCNLKVAKKVNLATFAAESAQWKGKCVAVQGYWNGAMLFADNTHRPGIAIYTNKRLSRMVPRVPRLYVAVGIADLCSDLPRDVMVMGYCHVSDGPYIAVAQMLLR